MPTFGNATGTSTITRAINAKAVGRHQAPATGSITKLTVKVDGLGTGTGNQVMKGVVYGDTSPNNPAALLGASAEVTVTDGQAAGEVDLVFATGIPITAELYYHLGIHTGANTNTIRWYAELDGGVSHASTDDTYSDGPSDPFGAGTESTRLYWIYATYTIAPTPVGAEVQALWNVQASVGAETQALWNTGAAVGAEVQALWNTQKAVGAEIQALWNTDCNSVGADVQVLWDVRAPIGASVQALWDVLCNSVGAEVQLLWNVQVPVATEIQALWNVLCNSVGAEVQLLWVVRQAVRLLPDTVIDVSTLEIANKVFVVVDGSSPLVVGSATNTTTAPTYAGSPRETLVLIGSGDATFCNAVAASQLALRKLLRYKLTGLPVRLRYGLGIQRGEKVSVTLPRAGITGEYAVRRLQHDFKANVTLVDLGEFLAPRDDLTALTSIAKSLAQLQKEVAV